MYVCICNGITERDIKKCIAEGACCIGDLSRELGVATQCGRCAQVARQCLDECYATMPTLAEAA